MKIIIRIFSSFLILLSLTIWLNAQSLFENRTIKGFDHLTNNAGVAVADYNNDGNLDIYVVATERYIENTPQTWSRLFKNNNDGTFSDVSATTNLLGSYGHNVSIPELPYFFDGELRHGASWGDYDNDGYADLFLTNWKFNKLYRNIGDGTFEDVTEVALLNDNAECYSTSSMWFDYNNDSHLDLLISAWGLCANSRLFENNGDGTFSDVSEKIHFAGNGNTWMTLPIDVNDDQWIDLLFINDFRSNALLVNDHGSFTEQTLEYGFNTNDIRNHMGATYADADNDGNLDVYISDINNNSFLYNLGDKFVNRAPELNIDSTEWSWQTRFGDMDLDGDQDILVVNGHDGFHENFYLRNDLNDGGLSFSDQSETSGFDENTNSMCFERFDFDHDGDLDVFITQLNRPPVFLENTTIFPSNTTNPSWVKVSLEGTTSNRSGIGSKVKITTESNESQSQFYSGVGFMTQSLQPIVFGLGSYEGTIALEIIWPSGIKEIYDSLPINSLISLTEGEGFSISNPKNNKVSGCTDVNSCNYDPLATISDGSCIYLPKGTITGSITSGIFRKETYSYSLTPGNTTRWEIDEGEILQGQGTSQVTVQWGINSYGKIAVTEIGNCHSEKVELEVALESENISTEYSIARMWNELLLEAIRNDYARPTVHARNLFHSSALMHDLYVLYMDEGKTYLEYANEDLSRFLESIEDDKREEELQMAISYAMNKFIKWRFQSSPGQRSTIWLLYNLMQQLGFDTSYIRINLQEGTSADIGNYVAQKIIDYGLEDGSREFIGYRNAYYSPINPPMFPEQPGNAECEDPNRWQPLTLDQFIDQSGNVVDIETPEFLSPEWGNVKPFSLSQQQATSYNRDGNTYNVFFDPGVPPLLDTISSSGTDEFYKWGFSLVSVWGAHLDPFDGVMWDISPNSIGNINIEDLPDSWSEYEDFYKLTEGGDIGIGYSVNPVTGAPYEVQMVPRGDYARVLAEFWADGPDSETPPGHWYTILNEVSDHPMLEKKYMGEGEELSDLEWDIKSYFSLGGAMHDAAIAGWSIKGWYDYIRPISAIRYMGDRGQSSDPNQPNYDPSGIPLIDGYVELVGTDDLLAGDDKRHVGKIKVKTWKGHDYIFDTETDQAGVDWILAENWWPYQRPSFVTPPFAGYVSGHSTYSRAAAEVLTLLTGDAYFPGGMSGFVAKKNEFLVFEEGPSQDIILQWATYRDASDQCSLSRIWGGIHPPADDIPGRKIGEKIGVQAFEHARSFFDNKMTLGVNKKATTLIPYPNPVQLGQPFIIKGVVSLDELAVYDLSGSQINYQLIQSYENGDLKLQLDCQSKGIYLVKTNGSSLKLIVN
ncbi:MAG: VCBS repeat-containing protein [Cyclobacteriaceae bacterium]